jgi:hypothetical protein
MHIKNIFYINSDKYLLLFKEKCSVLYKFIKELSFIIIQILCQCVWLYQK